MADRCAFCLLTLVEQERRIRRCQCCGGYFKPKKKMTLSCDRVIRAYEQFIDALPQTRYKDNERRIYAAQSIMSIASPMVIGFGIPPSESGISKICEVLDFSSLFDFLRWELMTALMHDLRIKRCENCGRFFVVDSGYAYEYCTHPISPEDSRTCREVGALESYKSRIKNDLI